MKIKSVIHMDVLSDAERITVALPVLGGLQARIAATFIFKNKSESYPIRGSPNNVHGVSYRTRRNDGWMDG